MSKIGKVPLSIPKGVNVTVKDALVTVEGPRGKLSRTIADCIDVVLEEGVVHVKRHADDKISKSMHGTTRSHLNNMLIGVSAGYTKELEIVGVGYKAQMKGKDLLLQIGFSRPVEVKVPAGIKVSTPAVTRIVVEGIDKHLVGQFAANIRKLYPPEPYKGKGIRYSGEAVRKKLGKAMAK